MCSLNSQISVASKTRSPTHHETVKSLRPGQSRISSPIPGYWDVLIVGNFFERFWFWAIWRALRNLDDHVLRGEQGEPGIQYCMTKYGSSCPQIVYRLRLPKRLVKQWKEGFKNTGRTLSENGRPEIFARNGTIPAKSGGLESLY